MLVKHFFMPKIAHSSYLLAGAKSCAIIDPQRDVDIYLEAAKELGMKITHILETHLHADFISGHMDLAEITGARIYGPESGECRFDHVSLKEGDSFSIEDIEISILETGGHTPEHISYVVKDLFRGPDPVGVFCGDTLFVGDVGRPDLFPGRARELAGKLFDNLKKLLALPDFCEVYPAHGAGSLCGRSMGAKWRSTIGYERRYNEALKISSRERFIDSLTTNMPGAPDHFSRCSGINRDGPTLVSKLPALKGLGPREFQAQAEDPQNIILDVRNYDSFGGQHIPNAYHIDFGGNLPTFAGWVLPPEKDILLVAYNSEQAEEARVWLHRVGLDRVTGYLDGGMFLWATMGLPTDSLHQKSVADLYRMATEGTEMVILDVRARTEYDNFHIEGAINIPAPELRTRYQELNPELPMALVCSTGHRSSLGASLLKQRDFHNLYNVAGGMTAYSNAGYVQECRLCVLPHGPGS
ncbi:MBL fold metallo-hydrolase [bacterium]|nr:MBL fold metallo-hydrolase [bacterium]